MMGDEVMGMVVIHVDNILYAGSKSLAKVVVDALGDSLPTKNLGEVKVLSWLRIYSRPRGWHD